MSSTVPPSANPEFFIDRSLGAKKLRRALEQLGYVAHTMNERYGIKQGERFPENDWIQDAGNHGFLILTKDDIRDPEPQIQAMEEAKAKVYWLTNAQLKWRVYVTWYLNCLDEILRTSKKDGPFMYGVNADHLSGPLALRPRKKRNDTSAAEQGILDV